MTMCPIACDGFLRLYEGSTEYLLPGRQYPYECVRECERFDRQIEEDGVQICEGRNYTLGPC